MISAKKQKVAVIPIAETAQDRRRNGKEAETSTSRTEVLEGYAS